jgi:hypothetical protein
MAIEFKKLDNEIRNSPLSEEELSQISLVEKHIDRIILEEYKGDKVRIELNDVNFSKDIDPDYQNRTEWKRNNRAGPRQVLMMRELESRYKKAGWKIGNKYSDPREGNMSGPDYWTLSGK